jgi:hypothetical protein
MLFTFKRDSEGREAIHLGEVAIARKVEHPEGWEWLSDIPGVTADHISDAAIKADEAGFWALSDSGGALPWGESITTNLCESVTVDVPIPETTSTVLSITNAEDQS